MTRRLILERALATHLDPVARTWRLLADQILATLGISNSAGWALVHLQRLGSGARQAELARAVGVAEPSLVRTVQQLERSGLVTRETDSGDRRANRVLLTEEGAALARRIDARLTRLRSELTESVSAEDLEVTVRTLEAIGGAIADLRGLT